MEQQKNNKQENKKNFVKPGYLPEDAPDCHPDEMALRKTIRNKNKKLNNIAELEQKVEANPDLELNDEQKGKIAAKKSIKKEIDDVIKQIKDHQKKQAIIDAEFAVKTKDLLENAVKNAVQSITNMVVMCTIANENPESVPEGLREGVDAFNSELKNALNTVNPHADFEWKSALASFSEASLKLAQGGAADLAAAVGKDSSIDKVIVSQHVVPAPATVEQVPAEVEAPAVQEEAPVEEAKEEAVAEQADAAVAEVQNEEEQKDSAFERRRGGGRGGRGGPRGGRPRGAHRNGEDDEGFKMTAEGGERRGGRGRGRGFGRGFRGGRGGFEGGRGGFEGEENFRGGRGGPRGGRGARKPRGGAPEDGAPTPAPTATPAETAN